MRKIMIAIMAILLISIMTAGTAFGLEPKYGETSNTEKQTSVEIYTPLNSEEYKGVRINFMIFWNGTEEAPESQYFQNAVKNYFGYYQGLYSNMPEGYFYKNRTDIENNVSELLKHNFGRYGTNITDVSIRDIAFYKKETHAEEIAYRNNGQPIIVYIDRSMPENNWDLIALVFAIGAAAGSALTILIRDWLHKQRSG